MLKNKKILILGKGLEGKATFKVLKKFFPKNVIKIVDPKVEKNIDEKINLYDIVIKSPGIPPYLLKTQYTTPTNLFFANNKNLVIGITGSKGKSTTASLIYHILKQAGKKTELLGNIGKPAIEIYLKKIDPKTIFVVELSSYQLNDIKFSPHISIITALFPEHLDYHQSIKNYYQAKKNIINYSQKTDYFIYLSKYRLLKQWAKEFKGKAINANSPLPFSINNQKLIGNHNLDNIKLAYQVAKIVKIKDELIKKSIETFIPLPHRLEYIGRYNQIDFYDDAISTTPQSTIVAIKALGKIGSILLGGLNRGYNFKPLVRLIIEKKIPLIVLFPQSGKIIFELIQKMKPNQYQPKILSTSSMEEAVSYIFKNSSKNTICLLSTASPSYSLWKNYQEKGNLFQKFVKKYGQKK